MRFEDLAVTLAQLENTSSQLRMVDILADLFENVEPNEIDKICYLTLGRICAEYKHCTMGLGSKTIQSAIALAADQPLKKVRQVMRKVGDVGVAAETLGKHKQSEPNRVHARRADLTVEDVHTALMRIATATGGGSQESKREILAELLSASDGISRRYVARIAAGSIRLGIGDKTILDALAVAFVGSRKTRPILEHAYNVCSDIGAVALAVAKGGVDAIRRFDVSLGKPVRPMLAQRAVQLSDIGEKIGSKLISVEEKYDGERIQAHKDGRVITLFSRRLTDITSQFPEVARNVNTNTSAEEAVLDGEVIAYDFDKGVFEPFQKLMQRRRRYDVERYAEAVPVKYMVFDILYLNGRSLLRERYPNRRKDLERVVKKGKYIDHAGRIVTSDMEELEEFFEECIERGLEGVVCKSTGPNSFYRAGAREWSWVKWKEEYATKLGDTLDLVVVGAFAGRGKRAGTYGSVLCAAYNDDEDTFETVCRVGTGFTDQQLAALEKKLRPHRRKKKAPRLKIAKEQKPDFWFDPALVAEVKGAEITRSPTHTCGRDKKRKRGWALRFPRFQRWREKDPGQATTTREVLEMYEGR
jgi:DNA ligase-1